MYLEITKQFIQEECCNCGVIFAISRNLQDNFKSTKKTFYCPNGHSQSYTKSTAQILQEEIEEKNKEISVLNNEIKDLKRPKRGRPKKK